MWNSKSYHFNSDFDIELVVKANDIVPEKSKQRYEQSYEKFALWCGKENFTVFDEDCLLAYFSNAMGDMKPTTKWSHYSMLKVMLQSKHNINMDKFERLKALLKQESVGHETKKASCLTLEQVCQFLATADDRDWLAIKVKK